MTDPRIFLYYMCSLAGFVMVVGGMWLLGKQKIYIDRESKEPVEVDLPLLGKFKTNYPALALFVLGFFPLVYPLREISTLVNRVKIDQVKIFGPVQTDAYPAIVYAARAQDALLKSGEFHVPVPFLGSPDEEYRVLLVVNGQIMQEGRAVRQPGGNEIEVKFNPIIVGSSTYQPNLVRKVPDEFK